MEGRATAAVFKDGKLTVWTSTQNAQLSRLILTAIGLPPDAIRVVAPDVGGGFGAKIGVDREQIIIAWAAKHTGRPVRWVETRNENLMAMTQGRAQLHHIKIGGDREGHIKAYRLDVVQDSGAYSRMGGFLPMLTNLMAPGVYDIPTVEADYKAVVTNGTPIAAYRGAGRPEAAATIERVVDWYAAEAGVDPARGAQAQLHQEGAVPVRHQDGRAVRHRRLRVGARQGARRRGLRRAARRAEAPPRRRARPGSSASASPPTWRSPPPTPRRARPPRSRCTTTAPPPSTPARPRTARATTPPTRCSCTEELGIPMDKIEVIHGDTDLIPDGVGTYASRSLQLGGSAVQKAAIEVKDEAAQEGGRALRGRRGRRRARRRHRHLAHHGRPGQVAVLVAGGRGRRPGADRRQRAVHRRPADVPVRHAAVARRGRRGDRQGHAAAARHRRRRGPGAQPDPDRGPAARRHRPGRRAGARARRSSTTTTATR